MRILLFMNRSLPLVVVMEEVVAIVVGKTWGSVVVEGDSVGAIPE